MRFTVGATLLGAIAAAFLAVSGVLGGGWYFAHRAEQVAVARSETAEKAVTMYQDADRERKRLAKVDLAVAEDHTKAVKAITKENTVGLQKSIVALEANQPWSDTRAPSDVLDSLR